MVNRSTISPLRAVPKVSPGKKQSWMSMKSGNDVMKKVNKRWSGELVSKTFELAQLELNPHKASPTRYPTRPIQIHCSPISAN